MLLHFRQVPTKCISHAHPLISVHSSGVRLLLHVALSTREFTHTRRTLLTPAQSGSHTRRGVALHRNKWKTNYKIWAHVRHIIIISSTPASSPRWQIRDALESASHTLAYAYASIAHTRVRAYIIMICASNHSAGKPAKYET